MSLTVTAIKAFKPQSKPTKYFDEKGLYILVNPSGAKWWRMKYRIHGKEKLLLNKLTKMFTHKTLSHHSLIISHILPVLIPSPLLLIKD